MSSCPCWALSSSEGFQHSLDFILISYNSLQAQCVNGSITFPVSSWSILPFHYFGPIFQFVEPPKLFPTLGYLHYCSLFCNAPPVTPRLHIAGSVESSETFPAREPFSDLSIQASLPPPCILFSHQILFIIFTDSIS